MTHPKFDPAEAVTFDLANGHALLDGAANQVLVPSDALLALCNEAGEEASEAMMAAIGDAVGQRVAKRLAAAPGEDEQAAVCATSFETVVEHLAGELALIGTGALSVERWGKALVLVHDQSPFGAEGDQLIAGILQAALARVSGRTNLRAVHLERNGVRARFLVVSEPVADDVIERLKEGASWGSVVVELHPGPSA